MFLTATNTAEFNTTFSGLANPRLLPVLRYCPEVTIPQIPQFVEQFSEVPINNSILENLTNLFYKKDLLGNLPRIQLQAIVNKHYTNISNLIVDMVMHTGDDHIFEFRLGFPADFSISLSTRDYRVTAIKYHATETQCLALSPGSWPKQLFYDFPIFDFAPNPAMPHQVFISRYKLSKFLYPGYPKPETKLLIEDVELAYTVLYSRLQHAGVFLNASPLGFIKPEVVITGYPKEKIVATASEEFI